MRTFKILLAAIFIVAVRFSYAQEGDLQQLLDDGKPQSNYTIATFKSTRIINSQSVEMTPPSELIFTVSHHFGSLNSGFDEFFGLDQSTIRLGFEYGINNWLTAGFGRSTYGKMFDGSLKFRLLRQQTGKRNIPLTVVYYSSANITIKPWPDDNNDYLFAHRLSYVHKLLIARKITSDLSLQITPALVHYNLVKSTADSNDILAIGFGGRYKILPRFTVNAEYFYVPANYRKDKTRPLLSLGVDIETGGHVFQLFLTNSFPIYDPGYITEVEGNWKKADIYLGFNITRVFSFR